MHQYQPFPVGIGRTSIVIRISHDRVVKQPRPEEAVEHERKILQHIGPHPLIIRSFDSNELILEYHRYNLRDILQRAQPSEGSTPAAARSEENGCSRFASSETPQANQIESRAIPSTVFGTLLKAKALAGERRAQARRSPTGGRKSQSP